MKQTEDSQPIWSGPSSRYARKHGWIRCRKAALTIQTQSILKLLVPFTAAIWLSTACHIRTSWLLARSN